VDRRVDVITAYDTSSLRIGWYLDYVTATSPANPNGAEYTQMIRLAQIGDDGYRFSPGQSQIEDIVDANPGAIWFVANEPDRRQFQDEIDPDVYAVAYHDLYHLIKGRDPTARLFPGSIVQATELRLRYLDLVLEAYRNTYGVILPADGWSIHGFILNEVNSENNPDNLPTWGAGVPPGLNDPYGMTIDVQDTDSMEFYQQQVERFRIWMAARGYRNVPLYMSEYGVLMPSGLFNPDFTVGRVNAFMDQTFDYLLTATSEEVGYPADNNRLVQRLSWYSVNDKGFNGYLFDVDNNNNLSLMGQNYAQYVAGMAVDLDLYPVKLSVTPVAPLVQDGAADLTLVAQIANGGNGQAPTEAEVRFYNGNPDAGGVQIGSAQTISVNGCGATVTAQVAWNDVLPAAYDLYVDVQPVSETDVRPENNRLNDPFAFADSRLLLPMASLPQ
jgi:hypothetical protein